MQKKYRLTSSKTFDYLYRKGASMSTRRLVLIYAPSKFNLRCGFVVSKKVGNAVVRNKARRRLKEIFRSQLPLLKQNCNYVLVGRAAIATSTFDEIKADIIFLLTKGNLYQTSEVAQ
ncbi:MAG: ribonuclease P protein component [Clostridia bacterium]